MANVGQFFPERSFGKGLILWHLRGPESKVAAVHCASIAGHVLWLRGTCAVGQEGYGGWCMDTPHTSLLAPPPGGLSSFYLNALLSKNHGKPLPFCKKSSVVVAEALGWSGLSESAVQPRDWSPE